MVRARAGGTGQRFNLGEATVTRCVVRPDAALTGTQQVGVGYVLGCSHRQALLVALASNQCPKEIIASNAAASLNHVD